MSSSDTVLVPRDPTDAMLEQATENLIAQYDANGDWDDAKDVIEKLDAGALYAAMLAASPQQSPISGEGIPMNPRPWSANCTELLRAIAKDQNFSDWMTNPSMPEFLLSAAEALSTPPVPSVSGVEDQGSSLRDTQPEAETAVVEHMVQRFLSWHLPANFNPDNGISFKPTFNDHMPFGPMWCNPTGTNLFDYDQAKAMVLHMLEGLPK